MGRRSEIRISIPDALKTQLVDDWEAITKNQTVSDLVGGCDLDGLRHWVLTRLPKLIKLVPLPRVPNVDTILDEWNKYLQNEDHDRRRYVSCLKRRALVR